jgi:hypothetical protein
MPRATRRDINQGELPAIAALIQSDGSVSIDHIDGVGCVASACDNDQCYAMLVRRPEEPLMNLLRRLDSAITKAAATGITIDEVNPVTPSPAPEPPRRSRR